MLTEEERMAEKAEQQRLRDLDAQVARALGCKVHTYPPDRYGDVHYNCHCRVGPDGKYVHRPDNVPTSEWRYYPHGGLDWGGESCEIAPYSAEWEFAWKIIESARTRDFKEQDAFFRNLSCILREKIGQNQMVLWPVFLLHLTPEILCQAAVNAWLPKGEVPCQNAVITFVSASNDANEKKPDW